MPGPHLTRCRACDGHGEVSGCPHWRPWGDYCLCGALVPCAACHETGLTACDPARCDACLEAATVYDDDSKAAP